MRHGASRRRPRPPEQASQPLASTHVADRLSGRRSSAPLCEWTCWTSPHPRFWIAIDSTDSHHRCAPVSAIAQHPRRTPLRDRHRSVHPTFTELPRSPARNPRTASTTTHYYRPCCAFVRRIPARTSLAAQDRRQSVWVCHRRCCACATATTPVVTHVGAWSLKRPRRRR